MTPRDSHPGSPPSPEESSHGSERFARLFSQHQQGLYRYIILLTGSPSDASDVLQETAVVLLRKIDQYDQAKPFMPWAKKFAYYEVLKYRTESSRRVPLLDEKVFDQITKQVGSFDPAMDDRREALGHCLQKLPSHQLDVIKMRYTEDIKPSEISEMTSRPVQTVYTQLKRARQSLLECIERSMRQGARA